MNPYLNKLMYCKVVWCMHFFKSVIFPCFAKKLRHKKSWIFCQKNGIERWDAMHSTRKLNLSISLKISQFVKITEQSLKSVSPSPPPPCSPVTWYLQLIFIHIVTQVILSISYWLQHASLKSCISQGKFLQTLFCVQTRVAIF